MNTKSLAQFRHNPRLGYIAGYLVILFIFLLLIFLFFSLVFFLEGYFFPYPAIDTQFAPQYSEAQFEQIKPGMTKEEILTRLGPPLNNPDDPAWIYSNDGAFPFWDFAWLVRNVQFNEEGRVIYTKAFIAYD